MTVRGLERKKQHKGKVGGGLRPVAAVKGRRLSVRVQIAPQGVPEDDESDDEFEVAHKQSAASRTAISKAVGKVQDLVAGIDEMNRIHAAMEKLQQQEDDAVAAAPSTPAACAAPADNPEWLPTASPPSPAPDKPAQNERDPDDLITFQVDNVVPADKDMHALYRHLHSMTRACEVIYHKTREMMEHGRLVPESDEYEIAEEAAGCLSTLKKMWAAFSDVAYAAGERDDQLQSANHRQAVLLESSRALEVRIIGV
ncbi:hypothetical protein DIPPA_08326 [Diplonema papillatum]|nr:hypothetical protein DIPPA_08326 [Diplonema papillatum]